MIIGRTFLGVLVATLPPPQATRLARSAGRIMRLNRSALRIHKTSKISNKEFFSSPNLVCHRFSISPKVFLVCLKSLFVIAAISLPSNRRAIRELPLQIVADLWLHLLHNGGKCQIIPLPFKLEISTSCCNIDASDRARGCY